MALLPAWLSAWILLVENLLLFVPSAARKTPGASGLALAGGPGEHPAAVGGLLLVLYATVTSGAGWVATARRDVV